MSQRPHPKLASASMAACTAAFVGLIGCNSAQAQASPYSIGISQTVSHETNLLRLREGQTLPSGSRESDTVSSTALVAGLDQRIGRQRLFGNGALRANRYAHNDALDSQVYGLDLGLDWETIWALSGKLNVGADRTQRTDLRGNNGQILAGGNLETSRTGGGLVRLGVAGPLGLEAGLAGSRVRYRNPAAAYADYDQRSGSLGARYQLGGATSVALTARQTRFEYPNLLVGRSDPNDKRQRDEIEFSTEWQASGASRIEASLSRGKTEHEQLPARDFSSTTGAVSWNWQPGGRLKLITRLGRDSGQNSDVVTTTAFSQTTDSLSLNASYELTGKTRLNAAVQGYRRSLVGNSVFISGIEGRDRGTTASLGLRWEALRSLTLGCQISRDERGRNSTPALNDAYSASVYSCFGQFLLQ
ncbi:MAG: hypothetical protein LH480_06790 [Rubrivivax sp.]|nr:hypothetical protein [Rubrivivax sp.]